MIEILPDEVKNDGFAPAQEDEKNNHPESETVAIPRKREIERIGFEKEKSHPAGTGQLCSSKCPRRGRNVLKKYINRFYKLCLLNLAAAITMLIIYKETGNEMIVPAIYACVANGLLTYMCVD